MKWIAAHKVMVMVGLVLAGGVAWYLHRKATGPAGAPAGSATSPDYGGVATSPYSDSAAPSISFDFSSLLPPPGSGTGNVTGDPAAAGATAATTSSSTSAPAPDKTSNALLTSTPTTGFSNQYAQLISSFDNVNVFGSEPIQQAVADVGIKGGVGSLPTVSLPVSFGPEPVPYVPRGAPAVAF